MGIAANLAADVGDGSEAAFFGLTSALASCGHTGRHPPIVGMVRAQWAAVMRASRAMTTPLQ
jgi:hypothetical protein